jgi:hypothetical protein
MSLIPKIKQALDARLPDLVIQRLESSLHSRPPYGVGKEVRGRHVHELCAERAGLFSEEEIARHLSEGEQRVALIFLGPGSILADLPIEALSARCGDRRLTQLVEECRAKAIFAGTAQPELVVGC